jgi:hypothetical protein
MFRAQELSLRGERGLAEIYGRHFWEWRAITFPLDRTLREPSLGVEYRGRSGEEVNRPRTCG